MPRDSRAVPEVVFVVDQHVTQRQIDALQILVHVELALHVLLEAGIQHA